MMFFSRWICKMRVNDTLYSCSDLRRLKERMYLDFKEKQAEEFEGFKAGIEDFLSHCKCSKQKNSLEDIEPLYGEHPNRKIERAFGVKEKK